MCHLSAGGFLCLSVCALVFVYFFLIALSVLSRCVIFGQGTFCVCLCALVFVYFD